MVVTSRDLELLKWINSFGFVFYDHIAQWMGVRYQTAHARIKKLKTRELIRTERLATGLPHLIYITRKGWRLTGDSLPPLTQYHRLHTLNHDVRLIKLHLHLQELYTDSRFISERWIRHNRDCSPKTHIPDGELYLSNAERGVAIELELSQKKLSRLRKIIQTYKASLAYEAVWYFTSPPLTQRVKSEVADDPMFRVIEVEYKPCL